MAALAASVAVGGHASAEGSSVQWLMVVQGEVASVSEDRMRLLTEDTALVFSDRPEREVDLIPMKDVAAAWDPGGSYHDDPPNASLVNEAEGRLAVLEVTASEWRQGDLDIRFAVLDGTLPADGDRVAITFDTFNKMPGGGGYQGD